MGAINAGGKLEDGVIIENHNAPPATTDYVCSEIYRRESNETAETLIEQAIAGSDGNDERVCRASKRDEEMQRTVNGDQRAYRRGPWTKEEDTILIKAVDEFGPGDWVKIESQSGLNRTSKSCRLRWKNHLRPNLKKGAFSSEEERIVIYMHFKYGNKWSLMAKHMPGRSDNEIKNFWHSRIKKCRKSRLPLYPRWCLEDNQTSEYDENSRNDDVGNQPNLNSFPGDDSKTTLVAPISLPEYQLASPAGSRESCPNSVHTVEAVQTSFEVFPSSQAQLSPSPQQPSISSENISQYQLNSALQTQLSSPFHQPFILPDDISQNELDFTFQTVPNSASTSNQLPGIQFCMQQREKLCDLPHLTCLHGPSPIDQSTQALLSPCDQSPRTLYPSFQYFLSPRPKALHSSPTPLTSISSAHPEFPLPQEDCFSSPPQTNSKLHSDFSMRNSSYVAFKPVRSTPVLSSPSGRFKRFHRATSELSPLAKPTEEILLDSAASVSSFHLSTSDNSSSHVNSPTMGSPTSPLKLNLSSKDPTMHSVQVDKSTQIAPRSASAAELNSSLVETAFPSYLKSASSSSHSIFKPGSINAHVRINSTSKQQSSSKWNPSTSESPISSLKLNSSLSEPCSFEPAEPPSIQFPRRDLLPNLGVKLRLAGAISENNSEILDALLQEAQVEACLSDLHLVEEYLFSQQLKIHHLYEKISRRKMLQNVTIDNGNSLAEGTSRKDLSNRSFNLDLSDKFRERDFWNSKRLYAEDFGGDYSNRHFQLSGNSMAEELLQGRLTRDGLPNVGSNGEDFLGRSMDMTMPRNHLRIQELLERISKKKGPLSEVPRAGISLVERRKNEMFLSELMKRRDSLQFCSQQGFFLSDDSLPKDLMFIESLSREKSSDESLLRASIKRKGPMADHEKCSINATSGGYQTPLEGKILSSEALLTSGQQVSVPGEVVNLNVTCLLKSNALDGKIQRAQTSPANCLDGTSGSSKRICLGNENLNEDLPGERPGNKGSLALQSQDSLSDALDPLYSHNTTTTTLNSGYPSMESISDSPYLLREAWSESLPTDCSYNESFINDDLVDSPRGELLLDSQDQLHGNCESSLLPCHYDALDISKYNLKGLDWGSGELSNKHVTTGNPCL